MRTPGSRKRLRYELIALAVVLILGVLFWRSRRRAPGEEFSETSIQPETAVAGVRDTNQLAGTLPIQSGPEGYVGSAKCKECHAKQFDSWWRTYHRQMTQVMTPESVKADFHDVVLAAGPARFTLNQVSNRYWVDIQAIKEFEAARLANSAPPAPLRLPLEMRTGSHYLQVFWMPTGNGNQQIGFPFTWLVAEKQWVPRNDAFIRDPNFLPAPEQWNKICIRCHATGARSMRNEKKKAYDTHVTELGIACEACHGPGETHIALERKLQRLGAQSNNLPSAIVQPAHLDHVRSSQVCGFCHSMKWFVQTPSWVQNGFSYRPGDDLEKTTPMIRPAQPGPQPWKTNSLIAAHPEEITGFFWPDGMMRVTGREFSALIESPCYQKGELACVTCHSMHKSNPDKQVKEGMDGNGACLPCHNGYQEKLTAHTHHLADSSGSLCYNCHMPYTCYGLLRGARSHQIDSPAVLATLKTGRPNACNLCHLNKTLKWTADKLSEWYKQPVPELAEEDQKISEIAKLLLSGDAAQRALAAYALGWEPALAASGTDWEAPLLANGLEDNYPAVQIISHRSLRHLPGFETFAYDVEGTLERRHDSVRAVLKLWREASASLPRREETLTGPGPAIATNAFLKLVRERDDRSIRIHE
jgi:predicted CXXCH cytochrome family protein